MKEAKHTTDGRREAGKSAALTQEEKKIKSGENLMKTAAECKRDSETDGDEELLKRRKNPAKGFQQPEIMEEFGKYMRDADFAKIELERERMQTERERYEVESEERRHENEKMGSWS